MFKFKIMGTLNKQTKPITIALTPFRDVANYIKEHASEALDPTGEHGLSVEVIVREEADDYIYPPRDNAREDIVTEWRNR